MKKIKRIAALTAVIAWGLLLLVTLITAFINTDSARTLFNGLIFTDIIFPIVILCHDARIPYSLPQIRRLKGYGCHTVEIFSYFFM